MNLLGFERTLFDFEYEVETGGHLMEHQHLISLCQRSSEFTLNNKSRHKGCGSRPTLLAQITSNAIRLSPCRGQHLKKHQYEKHSTNLQSIIEATLGLYRFWPCNDNGLIKRVLTTSHNLLKSEFQVGSAD